MTSGQFDINALFAQAQAMQQQVAAAADDVARSRVEGSAGGSLVRATVTGAGELVALRIAPEALTDGDAEMVADLVLAAVRDAVASAKALQDEAMGGFGDFGSLLGPAEGGTGPAVDVAPTVHYADDEADEVLDGELLDPDGYEDGEDSGPSHPLTDRTDG